ncbi:MAG: hypothetical protein IKG42_04590 [Clostridia bacterium]|nr:hypothetical protein [Clostridia bacterium]
MLNLHEKNMLRSTIQDFNFSLIEEDGCPIIDGTPTKVPSFEELKKIAFRQIYEQGFSLIQQVQEGSADCIIRVYQKLHLELSSKSTINTYGFMCFTKKSKGFKTISIYGKKEPYYKSNCTIKYWITSEEYVNLECEFKDYFIRVGKM